MLMMETASRLDKLKSMLGAQILVNSLALLVGLGIASGTARATTQQITVSVDGASVSTFSQLMTRAEALARATVAQQFQENSNITEVQVVVLGERGGQIVSILSSQVTRSDWQTSNDLRPWTQYFTTASNLLGYTSPSQVARRPSTSTGSASSVDARPRPASSTPSTASVSADVDPRDTVTEALTSGQISTDEYWDLMDELD